MPCFKWFKVDYVFEKNGSHFCGIAAFSLRSHSEIVFLVFVIIVGVFLAVIVFFSYQL